MKKSLFVLALVSSSFMFGSSKVEHKIQKLAQPYENAVNFIVTLDSARTVNDHDIFQFFNQCGLYSRKDVRVFKRSLSKIKKLTYKNKALQGKRDQFVVLINNLQKINNFIVEHSSTYYALCTHYEISAFYHYIDAESASVVNSIIQSPSKIGLSSMQGRGLYKLVKKIDLDIRRLTALFVQNIVSDDAIIKINQTKKKLVTLKSKIMVSKTYKSQLTKTRLLKAIGVFIPLCLLVFPFYLAVVGCEVVISEIALYAILSGFGITMIAITVQEMQESVKYNIPVHSNSLFSWFRPVFYPLTWIPRG